MYSATRPLSTATPDNAMNPTAAEIAKAESPTVDPDKQAADFEASNTSDNGGSPLSVEDFTTAMEGQYVTVDGERITKEALGDLETALDQYSEKIGSPRLTTVKRRAKTDSLVDLFTKLRDAHSRMDRLAVIFRGTAPEFLTAYQAARVIIDRPATNGSTPEPPLPS